MKNKRLIIMLTVVTILLLIPLIAMQFTNEVNWTILDFVVMGILLYGTALLCELAIRRIKRPNKRYLVIAGIVLLFLLIWAELAVGIFGTPIAGS